MVKKVQAIASADNAHFKALEKLAHSSRERRKRGHSVLDGVHLLAALLQSGREPESVFVDAAGEADPGIAVLLAQLEDVPVYRLADALFRAVSTVETPTGVICVAATPEGSTAPANARFILLLEDVQDPGNVGTMLRTAAAAGVEHVLLSNTCAFAWSPKVLRSAMGAHFVLNIVEGVDLAAWLGTFKGMSVALAPRARRTVYDLDLRGPVAFIVGNEGAGLTAAIEHAASERASLPMPGPMESLNAASAASACLFEAVRQRRSRS
jgi:RNA methyltransferase, TrmH family